MRQIYQAAGRTSMAASGGEPADDAAYAFCLGDVVIRIRLRDGRSLSGKMRSFSRLDHRRESGAVTVMSAESGLVDIPFHEISEFRIPARW
ncbi:hypothetical protein [Methylocella tundrae]|uniref:Uncharacterized protein n=1 Tax=Methylocella tundrae TaxID=227605 RepID=A0A4U8Z807_METTU|nr:hypothetical protein [Methylocella tundrae]WPP02930.1 hypothetical protein SIN04_02140 [Methylocella tundrae]VFU16588.1 protein of unknown function [Methylocella tundrae]